MTGTLAVLAAGGVLLYVGAEVLVREAGLLAHRLGVSTTVIGLTVVAFGTSAPELVVSVISAAGGEGSLSLGNVLGSNVFNIAFILGVSVLMRPMAVERRLVRFEIPFVIAASAGAAALMLDGRVGRADGLILLAAFGVYLRRALRRARSTSAGVGGRGENPPTVPADGDESTGPTARWSRERLAGLGRSAILTALGLALLLLGAELVVDGAVSLARLMGVSELLIGATLVAAGTSLPELATSAVAAARGLSDLAVANIVGSNVFNILAVLGLAALSRPIAVTHPALVIHLPATVLVAVLLLPLARTGFELKRWEGGVLLASYVAYVGAMVANAMP